MKESTRVFLLSMAAAGLVVSMGCAQLKARDMLNRGTNAYKAAQFNQAVEDFQEAIQLDPTLLNAKLYLATAYQSQFIPGAPSEDNVKLAQQAVDEYKVILQQDANNPNATAGLARLYYDMGDLDDSREFYQKSLQLNPNDPTAYDSLAAIDFQEVNHPLLAGRQSLGVSDPNAPFVPKGAQKEDRQKCDDMRQQMESKVEDGITNAKKAIDLDPNFADAMTYINLLYRQKADFTCGNNEPERTADIDAANAWSGKALQARKAEVAKENKPQGGVVYDSH